MVLSQSTLPSPRSSNISPRTWFFEKAWFWVLALGLSFALPLVLSLRRPQLAVPPVLARAESFELVDPDGRAFTQEELRSSVTVVTFVDGTCRNDACREWMENLYRLQKGIKGAGPTARVLSISTNPEADTPESFKKITQELRVSQRSWTFLTGTRAAIEATAFDRFKLGTLLKGEAPGERSLDSLRQRGVVMLIDAGGAVRSVYENVNRESLNRVVKDLAVLINTNPAR